MGTPKPDLHPVVPPSFPAAEVRLDPEYALVSQFMGMLEERERKRSIRRTFAFLIPRDLDAGIDRIIHDSRFQYNDDIGAFILHAIILLVENYKAMGYPNVELNAELRLERKLRREAEKARRRNAAVEALHQFDEEMDYACRHGDWESIAEHLAWLDELLKGTYTQAAKRRLVEAIVASATTLAAALTLHRICQARSDIPEEVQKHASAWMRSLSDLSTKE